MNRIQKSFGYNIKDIHFFIAAFTHKSISSEYNYERLEILGDAIIQFYVTEILFFKYPNHTEGDITVMRQNLVNSASLNKIFTSLNLSETSEQINTNLKGRNFSSDIFESLIAAIYLDSNHQTIKRIIKKILNLLYQTIFYQKIQNQYFKNIYIETKCLFQNIIQSNQLINLIDT